MILRQKCNFAFLLALYKNDAMPKFLLLTLICAATAVAPLFAQTKFRIGPEAGISVSRWGWDSKTDFAQGYTQQKMKFYAGPTAGIHAQLEMGKHLQWGLGLRYRMTGETYWRNFGYASDENRQRHQYQFHQLVMPFTIGYFIDSKFPVSFNLGIQPVWVLSGRYERSFFMENTGSDPITGIETFDLLNDNAGWYDSGRLYSQLHTSVSVSPSKRLKITLGYNTTGQMIYSKRVMLPVRDIYEFTLDELASRPVFRPHDMFLSVAYFLGTAM